MNYTPEPQPTEDKVVYYTLPKPIWPACPHFIFNSAQDTLINSSRYE